MQHKGNSVKILVYFYGYLYYGSEYLAELCANNDANHICTKLSQFFFLQKSFIVILTKEYVFVFENFTFFHRLKI